MDPENNNIPEYVQRLPAQAQAFVMGNEWQNRVFEIAQKYSLTETQKETLADNVLFVLIGLDTPNILVENMPSELGVSQLLSEQIIKDVETRIFEYALNTIENSDRKEKAEELNEQKVSVAPKPQMTQVPRYVPPYPAPQKSTVGEVSPKSPGAVPISTQSEKGTVPDNLPGMPLEETPTNIVFNSVEISPEPVQRPVAVPRFIAPKDEDAPTQQSETPQISYTPKNIIDAKLNTTVTAQKNPELNQPVKSYSVDPYREPIE